MRFDWTISLGTMLHLVGTIAIAISVVLAIKNRLNLLEQKLEHHAGLLKGHNGVLEKFEGRILALISDVQRLIGQTTPRE